MLSCLQLGMSVTGFFQESPGKLHAHSSPYACLFRSLHTIAIHLNRRVRHPTKAFGRCASVGSRMEPRRPGLREDSSSQQLSFAWPRRGRRRIPPQSDVQTRCGRARGGARIVSWPVQARAGRHDLCGAAGKGKKRSAHIRGEEECGTQRRRCKIVDEKEKRRHLKFRNKRRACEDEEERRTTRRCDMRFQKRTRCEREV